MKYASAPTHLRPETAAWFSDVCATYELEPHDVRLLIRAAEAWDLGEEAREATAISGLTYTDRFGAPRAHPAIAIGRDARIAFARLIRELSLGVEPPSTATRPPALRSNGGSGGPQTSN